MKKSIDNILGKDKKKKSKMKNSSILEPALREQEIEVDYEDYDEFDNDDQISRNQDHNDNDEFDIDQIMGYQNENSGNENLNDKKFNDQIKILIDQNNQMRLEFDLIKSNKVDNLGNNINPALGNNTNTMNVQTSILTLTQYTIGG